ncbi:TPA: helix-turn-helix domain-containing protein [Vibrio vulnificus]|uniref:Helix-turn-helix transcriptional regulator n=1 Tax=Vibrio diabolicus TaxID=50719 RepID=A0AA92R6P6_9VIBR|nr:MULTISPECIES: helix-turn-helix transcriptional regulator [Vibrio]EKO3501761.1 helix-turn-helix transcriptional regulator [Vibrio fluvialis]HAS6068409.1 helix-turn-helix domain-containing protein [Vibrio vulnificus]EHA1078461.1 helix-turn-helix transcriptional regulator [Vibrio alginolyticus]EHA1136902.1 helix-turn-helix transcriptional regulator [Vibrio alginolyticus]EJB8586408.1 helix-turn-helix transcriptional regulator [Vibrio parahaemolyticus]
MSKTNPFPQRLKQARNRVGISQRELGIRLGMDPSSASGRMNHYEKGRHMPDIGTLQKLAQELGVPVAFFFSDSDSSAELACLIEQLNEKEKQALITQLKQELDKSDNA